jgi:hypothetical protein
VCFCIFVSSSDTTRVELCHSSQKLLNLNGTESLPYIVIFADISHAVVVRPCGRGVSHHTSVLSSGDLPAVSFFKNSVGDQICGRVPVGRAASRPLHASGQDGDASRGNPLRLIGGSALSVGPRADGSYVGCDTRGPPFALWPTGAARQGGCLTLLEPGQEREGRRSGEGNYAERTPRPKRTATAPRMS